MLQIKVKEVTIYGFWPIQGNVFPKKCKYKKYKKNTYELKS